MLKDKLELNVHFPLHLLLRTGLLRQTRQAGLLGGATTAGQSLRTVSSGRTGLEATTYLPTASLSLVSSGHAEEEPGPGLLRDVK